jgi:hypothetical protein
MSCSSVVVVTPDLAGHRKTIFQPKLTVLKSLTPSKDCHDIFPLDLGDFVAMLNDLIAEPDYNGLRIHFACYLDSGSPTVKGKEGFLTICFVPTIGVKDQKGGDDDEDNFSYVDGDGHIVPDPDRITVGAWVQNYRKNRVGPLEKEGGGKVSKFEEALTLWYPRDSIRAPADKKDKGLLDFIECLAPTTNPVVKMQIEFAAFLLGTDEPNADFQKYQYKLTLFFDLIQRDDKIVSFGSTGNLDEFAQADTGIPCPPNGGCPPPPPPGS